ncbi:Glutaredoxin-C9 [Ananas comosus]|uniref:Glutaredoxin-C9 n=1 Tax=Ananas comosus TaxID=4615 RepID=A0A199UY47_ANACO|nr:Glutaredoxin-C9 [Ananas comosus]
MMRMVEEEEEEGEEQQGRASRVVVMRGPYERVARMASGNAVVVFSVSGCCMCHVVKRLLLGLGVGPTVYELDQLDRGVADIQAVLSHLLASTSPAAASGASGSATASRFRWCSSGASFWEGWKR